MILDLGTGRDTDVTVGPGEPVDLVVRAAGGTGHLWSLEVVAGDCRVESHAVTPGTDVGGAAVDRFRVVPGFAPVPGSPKAVPDSPTAVPDSPTAVPDSPTAVPDSPTAVPGDPTLLPGEGSCALVLRLRAPWRAKAALEHRLTLRWGSV